MKKIVLCFAILLMSYAFVNAACTSPCAFQQPWYMTSGVKDAGPWTNGTTQNFWCLSDPSGANDQGTGANWWVLYTPTVWQINGNWGNGGVDGCCGMAAEGFDSMAMMVALWQDDNPATAAHSGEYFIVSARKDTTNGFFRLWQAAADLPFGTMPVPAFSGATTGGGNVTITLNGWRTGSAVNYYHWPGTGEMNPTQNGAVANVCSPGRTAVCPAPVTGYNIMSFSSPCGTAPANGLASAWTGGGAGCAIAGRATLPSGTCVKPIGASNCVYLATQVTLADTRVSYYVSANSLGIWVGPLGGEISGLAANYVSRSDIKVNWNSVAEGNVAGFNVYRSYSATGTFSKINGRTIPAVGTDGSSYLYKDRITSTSPRNAYYKIEIVRPDGSTAMQPDVAVANASPKSPMPRI
ncbi:MAG: hypothetical protein A2Y62_08330 [Candidatus Fischerbacteria bacterium RBG_13_37_8]|uniref:Fibronectin type-III domain-containing protein n=1 Tax=Candidatus Fischerbacteria bacterium RBG_13_37_8 TaxID=1817863 RepID=A0A1F5VHG1_9BACT|nr:MAG: hypothetical protein A2Y62_08330 [Candidatus Fischerbacteria bacterium RBG_13_37_8]